jgi:peptidoglycan/xylan/chitin deacetylase (PgdA/CDA1 family)
VDGGALNAMTNIPPYIVDWNTTRLPNGVYTLRITTYDGSQREIATTARTIRLANNNAPTESGRLSDEEKATLRSDLTTLLTPQPSRKAVRYLLAERAIARKATNDALTHMEAVVAMDPQFKGAFHTLRRYHDATGDVAPSLWKASVTEKAVALTFDDGPKPDGTPQLLDRLKELGIVGTFFIVGAQAEQNPGLLKRIFAEGHEIGNHSFTHPNLTYLPPIAVQRELCRTSALVRQLTGKAPRFYRPPGGNFNGAVAECAEALGMGGGYWTIDVYKFEKEPFGPKDVINFTLPKVRPGSIVLMHNGPKQTTDALPTIVKSLREKGYRFVTMTELARLTKI